MNELINSTLSQLGGNEFFQGGIVLAALSYLAYSVKNIPVRIWSKIKNKCSYTIYFDETDSFYNTFSKWFQTNYNNRFRNVEIRFSEKPYDRYERERMSSISADKKFALGIKKYQYIDFNVIWYKKRLLWISKGREKLEAASNLFNIYNNFYQVSGLFAKGAIEALCNEIRLDREKEIQQYQLKVFYSTWKDFKCKYLLSVKPMDRIIFENKNQLIQDLHNFQKRKDFYLKKGIKFKRNYLFSGIGGTGKTSLAQAIAHHLNYNLYILNIQELQGMSSIQELTAQIDEKSVILLEDIDCLFHHKKKRKLNTKKGTFSDILNLLDGVLSPEDCIFILTTNHPEKLDHALIRKGRIDLHLEMGTPTPKLVEEFLQTFFNLKHKINLPPDITKIDFPMSEVQDICLTSKDAVEAVHKVINRCGHTAIKIANV